MPVTLSYLDAVVGRRVSLGKGTWIGDVATVSNNFSIFGDCMIGVGIVVIQDIDKTGTYVGVLERVKDK